MDAGISSYFYSQSQRSLLQGQFPQRTNSGDNLDRFIPNRSAMDFDYGHYMLMKGPTPRDNPPRRSPSSEAYQRLLAEVLGMNRTRILAFKNKPPTPVDRIPDFSTFQIAKLLNPRRHIRQTPDREVDAPGLVDDYYSSLLDWGTGNVLAIALGNTVHLWDASNDNISELVTIEDEDCPVTSLKWSPDGRHIAIGLYNSDVQYWDSTSKRQLRIFRGCHQSRVSALDWNNQILTTGGMDGQIVNNDVRIRDHIVNTYRGHHHYAVCGLKWSASGTKLASGGNDNRLHIWDRSVPTRYLHRLEDHKAAVKALAWCPFQGNLLASGGGANDRTIKFWDTHTGTCLNSIDTGSQVCALLWNKNERELLSSHGYTQNNLTLWKHPSMFKIAELTGHTTRVLFMAQEPTVQVLRQDTKEFGNQLMPSSPDGCTVASAAGDETLRFWNVFGNPEVAKRHAQRAAREPFANVNRIR